MKVALKAFVLLAALGSAAASTPGEAPPDNPPPKAALQDAEVQSPSAPTYEETRAWLTAKLGEHGALRASDSSMWIMDVAGDGDPPCVMTIRMRVSSSKVRTVATYRIHFKDALPEMKVRYPYGRFVNPSTNEPAACLDVAASPNSVKVTQSSTFSGEAERRSDSVTDGVTLCADSLGLVERFKLAVVHLRRICAEESKPSKEPF